jgi:hypothetical protein
MTHYFRVGCCVFSGRKALVAEATHGTSACGCWATWRTRPGKGGAWGQPGGPWGPMGAQGGPRGPRWHGWKARLVLANLTDKDGDLVSVTDIHSTFPHILAYLININLHLNKTNTKLWLQCEAPVR